LKGQFDAVVIGGGPAGATAAALLARKGWKVAVIEKALFPRRKVCGEFLSSASSLVLRELGLEKLFLELAGPEIRQAGVFVGDDSITAEMPRSKAGGESWGRALGREQLDTILLNRARELGAEVWQPWWVADLVHEETGWCCRVASRDERQGQELRARVVVAAHGSWEARDLPSPAPRLPAQPSDLLAFKAHFRNSRLSTQLMPLLAFPGGYGGMVQTSEGRTSVSFCIRRDQLQRCREVHPGQAAGAAVLQYVLSSCGAAREALEGAFAEAPWLSAGPIRPGIRVGRTKGVFLVGNAAGEAHPVIAEGISMALQGAWLLCEELGRSPEVLASPNRLQGAQEEYERRWRQHFAKRIRTAALVACWAMHPKSVAWTQPWLRRFPSILTAVARRSGKEATLAGSGT
jgi:flavin-dependent dehydrogenase